jgi:hypothetical protein
VIIAEEDDDLFGDVINRSADCFSGFRASDYQVDNVALDDL